MNILDTLTPQPARAVSFKRSPLGFTLLEVMVALAILGLSMGALLDASIGAISSVDRTEGMTLATLLARGKMLDLERQLLKDGFKVGTEEREGNFEEEGFKEIQWHAKIMEIKLQTDRILEMVSSQTGENSNQKANPSPAAMFAPVLQPIGQALSQNARFLVLQVSWPEGKKRSHFEIVTLLSSKQMNKSIPPTGSPPSGGGTK